MAARLNEAKEAVQRAQEKPAEAGMVKEAKEAVERATAEVNAAAAETERRQLAVKIGELGRAAEALERAAAHQRDLSEKAAAKKDGFTPAEAKELHKEQQEVAKVAANTAEGVKKTRSEGRRAGRSRPGDSEGGRRTGQRQADAEGRRDRGQGRRRRPRRAGGSRRPAAGTDIKETA